MNKAHGICDTKKKSLKRSSLASWLRSGTVLIRPPLSLGLITTFNVHGLENALTATVLKEKLIFFHATSSLKIETHSCHRLARLKRIGKVFERFIENFSTASPVKPVKVMHVIRGERDALQSNAEKQHHASKEGQCLQLLVLCSRKKMRGRESKVCPNHETHLNLKLIMKALNFILSYLLNNTWPFCL